MLHVRTVLLGLPPLIRFTGDWLFRIRLARRKLPYTLVPNADGSYPIEFNSEQAPLACNRVSLGPDSDCHGLRRIRIEWRLSEWEVAAARRALLLFRSEMNRSGVARLELGEEDLDARLRASPPLGGHHMGTARMAAADSRGVVDGNCAVFGLPNLFVASSAVFPTSGHANPTLTIVALAVRLAAHLDATLAGAAAGVRPTVRASDPQTETS
jgi:choline dehydrogenase-like flavoprotein